MPHEPAPDRLWIEVDPGAEPITGTVHRGTAAGRPFAGWLELLALLDGERAAESRPAAGDPSA
jgi:hypothetical protein